jgi:hypothetical protein
MRPINGDVDAVADRLAQGNLTAAETEELWHYLETTVVLPMIQRLEEELDCDTLGTAAEEKLRGRLQRYRRAKGRFPRWLERTLVNLTRDEQRKRRRRGGFGMQDPDQLADARGGGEEPAPSLHEQLTRALTALRTALDELESRPRARQQKTDYHAMLLLELRLAMATRLRGHRNTLAEAGTTRAAISAARLPWTAGEQAREIQPGWPKLQTVWQVLADELARTDELLTDDDVVRLLATLPGVAVPTSVAWRQWRTRATQAASEHLGTDRFEQVVAGWL